MQERIPFPLSLLLSHTPVHCLISPKKNFLSGFLGILNSGNSEWAKEAAAVVLQTRAAAGTPAAGLLTSTLKPACFYEKIYC